MKNLILRSTYTKLIYAAWQQQIKSFDKNKEISIDGAKKMFIWNLYYARV